MSPRLPAPGPASMEQCALRRVRWKAASPEAPHKGQIELCSPTSAAARVLGWIATRYTPPEAASRRPASQGHPETGSKANQNNSRHSPASRRDLTVSCGRSACPEEPASPTRRPSLRRASLGSRGRPRLLVNCPSSATCRCPASPGSCLTGRSWEVPETSLGFFPTEPSGHSRFSFREPGPLPEVSSAPPRSSIFFPFPYLPSLRPSLPSPRLSLISQLLSIHTVL